MVEKVDDVDQCRKTDTKIENKQNKSVRRGGKNRSLKEDLTIFYNNVQGFSGKKNSLMEIFDVLDPDICLLTETMVVRTKLEGTKPINPVKSVGQNVAILLRKKLVNHRVVKIYEPNDTANMMGIRLEMKNNGLRVFTAHLKQLSVNTRSVIQDQFEEIRCQFREANSCQEAMLLAFDANVHLGDAIRGCVDKQDWGGKILRDLIQEEDLILVNNQNICFGVVTRVDPRTGTGTTIDYVICNKFMSDKVERMDIDEEGVVKPTKYTSKKVTTTDHNSITVKLRVEKVAKIKLSPFVHTKHAEGRDIFSCQMTNSNEVDTFFNGPNVNVDDEFKNVMSWWNKCVDQSFPKISRNKQLKTGVCDEVKELMRKERWIKQNIITNPDRGRMIHEVRTEISAKIAANRTCEMESMLSKVMDSRNPHTEVFKVRRRIKKAENIAFPLKNSSGNLQVTRGGIDSVINEHFTRVFGQLKVPDDDIWMEYWSCVDMVHNLLYRISAYDESKLIPKKEEIFKIIQNLNAQKSVNGEMTIDLVKLGGEKVWNMIVRCIMYLAEDESLPLLMRVEKMVLLYKNSGEIYGLDNYRGIFLRHVILSVYQKWLYSKSAPILDISGTEFAFGGRTERCVQEALLVVRLIQDHANWTGKHIFIKFMDVEKFFDTMNFKKALIDAYNSGLNGKKWILYNVNNKSKTCVPSTPLGLCTPIPVTEVFVQGSNDAVLMAWNTMDARNKKVNDMFDPVFIVENVLIKGLTFIDDIIEFSRTIFDVICSLVSDEVFEKESRLRFKPPKCKIMTNCDIEGVIFVLNNIKLDVVDYQKYLGTIIEMIGRNKDILKRISDSQGVINEIVQICKSPEIATHRLKFVNLLIQACLCGKVKYGCEMWDELSNKQKDDIDEMKVKTIKRVLEVSYSVPSAAVKYDFGLIDLSLEIAMEKVLLTVKVLNSDDGRIAKKLLSIMLKKNVPGYCSHVQYICKEVFEVELEELLKVNDLREMLKKKAIKIQESRIMRQMLTISKTNQMLMNSFSFDGERKVYLNLPFDEAKMIFLVRTRMLLTKDNYPGRWGEGRLCNVCERLDSDQHLFRCPGYSDLIRDDMSHDMFISLDCELETLRIAAIQMRKINERLKVIQEAGCGVDAEN